MTTNQPKPDQVVSLDEARRRRDEAEELRLEQLVIERWNGPAGNGAARKTIIVPTDRQ